MTDGAHEPFEGGIQFLKDVAVLYGKGFDEGALGQDIHERLCKNFVGCIVIGQFIAAVLVFAAFFLFDQDKVRIISLSLGPSINIKR